MYTCDEDQVERLNTWQKNIPFGTLVYDATFLFSLQLPTADQQLDGSARDADQAVAEEYGGKKPDVIAQAAEKVSAVHLGSGRQMHMPTIGLYWWPE